MLSDMNDKKNTTYVFSHTTLIEALKEWELEQIEAYPDQIERIQTTVVAMQHFLRSENIKNHKMILSGNPDDFDVVMPEPSENASKKANKK